ncbi:MAG TPA: hypothetical protein PKE29_18920, partial [Phycisphaerales bacterium]|nr:hypothetical protein [Phycisphaerales bacterium]
PPPPTRPINNDPPLPPHSPHAHSFLSDFPPPLPPAPISPSPADRVRLAWARNIDVYAAGGAPPYPAAAATPITGGDRDIRWAFSSSYEVTVSAFDGLQSSTARSGPDVSGRMRNTPTNHFIFTSTPWKLRQQPLHSVAFPGQKVFLHEGHARHEKRDTYYAYPGAKVNVLTFDGSASYKSNTAVNRGWDPLNPANGAPFQYRYVPDRWEAPAVGPAGYDLVYGFYRYTRGGLRGIDFGGKELNTGQP